MAFRQAVISIYPYNQKTGGYDVSPKKDIIFRQPYHNFGLAMSFNFTKTFDCPFSNCEITVHNPTPDIVDSIRFNYETYFDRPKVEIRSGESEYRLKDLSLPSLEALKGSLSLVYSGCPIWFVEQKIVGGRILNMVLSDISAVDASVRVTQNFSAGLDVMTLLTQLSSFSDTPWELEEIERDVVLSNTQLKHEVIYMFKNLYSQILPELSRIYGFLYNRRADGSMHFISSRTTPTQGTLKGDINNRTGLIEYPTKINWNHWQVKTFYGRPFIAYPWEWVSINASNLDSTDKVMQAMVIEAAHKFNDESAEIIYKVAPNGEPAVINPIIPV